VTRPPIVVALLVALAALGGCQAVSTPPPGPSAGSSSPIPSPPPTPSAVAFAGDPRTLLIPLPPGATPEPRRGSEDGRLTVVQAAALHNPQMVSEVVDYLTGFDFVEGAYSSWHDPAGNVVVLQLLEFGTVDQGELWTTKEKGLFGLSNLALRSDALATVPGGRWIELKVDNGYAFLTAVFGKGTIGAVLTVVSPGTANLDLLNQLAAAQYANLP
jgi:hypothetical protein